MSDPVLSERDIQATVHLALGSRLDVRIFRQNTGAARTGKGAVVRFGTVGQADLSGIVMLAPFVGIRLEVECKSARGRVSDEQRKWGMMIARFGGIYFVTRSAEDALAQLDSAIETRRSELALHGYRGPFGVAPTT